MEQALQETLERTDGIIETIEQQPPPSRLLSSEEKSLHEKLYDIYVEECEKDPEAEGLQSNVNLLKKLMKKESLACLVVNLYPENQGYSLKLKDKHGVLVEPFPVKSGSFSETFHLPYDVEKLLEYLDAEELPSLLIDILKKSPVNVFHHGCVIAEIRDYRQCRDNIYPPGELCAEPAVSPAESSAYQTRHVLLRPMMYHSDVESITCDNHQWTEEEKLELKKQLILATEDPSVAVTYTANDLLFNEQKMMTDSMRQGFKRHACPSMDQQEVPSGCICPPGLTTMTPFKKQAKIRTDDPYDLNIAGAETRKQRLRELTMPSEMDMQKYVKGMPSLLFDDEEPSVLATPEVNYDYMCDNEDGNQLWEMNPDIMKSLNEPLFSAEIGPLPEDRSDSHMYLPHISLDDYSDEFMARVNTGPRETVGVYQGSVQSKATCPGKIPQRSSSSVRPPQPSLGMNPTSSLVPSLEKESSLPLGALAPISRRGSSAISCDRDTPSDSKAIPVVQQTTVRESRVSTLPEAGQSNVRSSETNPKAQHSPRTTGVNLIDMVKSVPKPRLD
ncbi:transcription factor SPT20 homolog [Psammomys obesus]|uniref:transcription factor SPT20 homolog n=1 Tax=Psammomys obesus TaxID=48139 RepID=UPI002452E976|nr:transcription factor SPT20 homolog [Psammomys obesus]